MNPVANRRVYCSIPTGLSVHQLGLLPAAVALPDGAASESTWQLPGQQSGGALLPEPKKEWIPEVGYRSFEAAKCHINDSTTAPPTEPYGIPILEPPNPEGLGGYSRVLIQAVSPVHLEGVHTLSSLFTRRREGPVRQVCARRHRAGRQRHSTNPAGLARCAVLDRLRPSWRSPDVSILP